MILPKLFHMKLLVLVLTPVVVLTSVTTTVMAPPANYKKVVAPVAVIAPVMDTTPTPVTPTATPTPPTPAPIVVPPPISFADTYSDSLRAAPQDTVVDSWGMYNRECVSYTAFKVQETYGDMPDWNGLVPDANRWPTLAANAGIATGSEPRVHSVAILSGGTHGHSAWVEQVNNDGTMYVSQYNAANTGTFSWALVASGNYQFIYFK